MTHLVERLAELRLLLEPVERFYAVVHAIASDS